MRSFRLLACTVFAAVAAAGCVRSNIEMLAPVGRYKALSPDSVTVFVSPEDITAQGLEYERIAMIFIRADARYTNERAIMRRAREDAAKIGANGVILGDTREPSFWSNDRQGRVLAVRTRPRAAP